MASMRPLGTRSSLFSHSVPLFYACYLLKSVQTPQSTAIYIGSTPSPPRRIRQHNGEIAAGAKKTRSKRPWIMQMIVYGFPSRLAALQFEWAWQHPHRSRHLRDVNGSVFGTRASKLLKKNVTIVRTMISRHPYNIWPLHVKIFTEEVANQWRAADEDGSLPLPQGFTYTVELEGVDGKSGHPGSGREGPISVDDAKFTSEILAKSRKIIDSGRALNCSICHGPIESFSKEPTKSALCPSSSCEAVGHLDCLSRHFIEEQPEVTTMIPRGGHCNSCGNYTLWGDVIRGCYRRFPPMDPSGDHPDVATDDMFVSDDDGEDQIETPKVNKKKRSSSLSNRRKSSKQIGKAKKGSQSSEGESFDFNNISSSSEDINPTPMKRTPGRPRKIVQVSFPPVTSILPSRSRSIPTSPIQSVKSKGKGKEEATEMTSDIENMFSNIALRSDTGSMSPTKRRPGRPRNSSPLPSPVSTSKIPFTGAKKKTTASPTSKPRKLTGKKKSNKTTTAGASLSSSEGEFFDFDNIASSSENERPSPVKAKVGRPRKPVGFTAPGIPVMIIPSPKTRLSKPSPRIGTSVGRKERITGTFGMPHAREVIDLTALASSSDSGSSTGKKARSRPRKSSESIKVIDSSPDVRLSSGKKPRGRPRNSSASHASSSDSGSSLAKKKTRGRPRKDAAGLMDNASGSERSSSAGKKAVGRPRKAVAESSATAIKRARGRPRSPMNKTSGSESGPSAGKRAVGRPRKTVTLSSSTNSLSSAIKRARGRPRSPILQPTNGAFNSDRSFSTEKKARGRPRKNIDGSPNAASITDNVSSAAKKSRGRPRKSSEPSIISPLASPKTHKSSQHDPILNSKRKYHQSTAPSQVLARTSNLRGPIASGSRIMTSIEPAQTIKPLPSKKQRNPVSPSNWREDGLERTMSTLHVTTPTKPSQNRRPQKENIEVIVLSD